jgi:hypothetical protein
MATADLPGAFLLPDVDGTLKLFGVLHSTLAVAICQQYPSFQPFLDRNNNLYVQLTKYLYGTDIAANKFYQYCLKEVLPAIKFEPTLSDKCLFVQPRSDKSRNLLLMHVDDLLIITHTQSELDNILSILQTKWKVTTQTGNRIKHLGMIIERNRPNRTISLSMPDIINKIIALHDESSAPNKTTPAQLDLFYLNADGLSPSVPTKPFMSALMTILYPARFYRYDILLTVSTLASAMSKPTELHQKAIKHLIGYIRQTKDYQLTLGGSAPLRFKISTDAGHGSHLDGKSQIDETTILGDRPVSKKVQKLKFVTTSSFESEVGASSESGKQAVHLIQLRLDLGLPFQQEPITLEQDNQSAIQSNNTGIASFKRAKHIHVRNMFITDLIQTGVIVQKYVPSLQMLADMGTKFHSADRIKQLCDLHYIG